MPEITGHGWEIKIVRLGLQTNTSQTPSVRTYGTYQVFIDGQTQAALTGHICERTGPGDNSAAGKSSHARIEAGVYPLSTQFGTRYASVGFTGSEDKPMPGIAVMNTGSRSAILIHPGHHPRLYISSIGCFNPTKPLRAADLIDFTESRSRVIALLASLKQHDPSAFARVGRNTAISHARMILDGEPMNRVADS